MPGDTVQLDLLDRANGGVYEVKTNLVEHIKVSPVTHLSQAARQAALIGRLVNLHSTASGEKIEDYRINSVTWVSVATHGLPGFGDTVAQTLWQLGIRMRAIW